MILAELIEKLASFPQDMEVLLWVPTEDEIPAGPVESDEMAHEIESLKICYYDGETIQIIDEGEEEQHLKDPDSCEKMLVIIG